MATHRMENTRMGRKCLVADELCKLGLTVDCSVALVMKYETHAVDVSIPVEKAASDVLQWGIESGIRLEYSE